MNYLCTRAYKNIIIYNSYHTRIFTQGGFFFFFLLKTCILILRTDASWRLTTCRVGNVLIDAVDIAYAIAVAVAFEDVNGYDDT